MILPIEVYISRLNPKFQEYKSYLLLAVQVFLSLFFLFSRNVVWLYDNFRASDFQQLLKTFLRRSLRDKLADAAGRNSLVSDELREGPSPGAHAAATNEG